MSAALIAKALNLFFQIVNKILSQIEDSKMRKLIKSELLGEQAKALIEAQLVTRKIMQSPVSDEDRDEAAKTFGGNDG